MKTLPVRAVSPQAVLFGLSSQKKSFFFRQLATMVQSGLPVSRAVHTSSQQGLAPLGEAMSLDIDHGANLSEAMSKYPYHFDEYEIAMVKAGEVAGQLDHQLSELAKSAESSWALSKQLTSKLIYPAVVIHGAIFLPPLFLLVKDGLAAYLSTVLMVLVPLYVVAIGSFLGYRVFRTRGGPRRLFDHMLSNLPVIAPPMRSSARIRFFEALSNLTEAGFLPDQSIPLAANACGNYWLRDRVIEAWNVIGKEAPISAVLRRSKGFSAVELGLVSTGEEAGQFAATLHKAAETMKPDFEAQVHRITTILPIVLLLFVGVIVGFVAVKSMMGILAPLNDLF